MCLASIDGDDKNIDSINDQSPAVIKLLCGADLLESFAIPNLWMEADVGCFVFRFVVVIKYHSFVDGNWKHDVKVWM